MRWTIDKGFEYFQHSKSPTVAEAMKPMLRTILALKRNAENAHLDTGLSLHPSKRGRKQESATIHVEGLQHIISRPRLVWSSSMIMLRRFSSDVDGVLSSDTGSCTPSSDVGPAVHESTLSCFLFARKRGDTKSILNTSILCEASDMLRDITFKLLWSARMGKTFEIANFDDLNRETTKVLAPSWLTVFFLEAARAATTNPELGKWPYPTSY